MHKLLNQKRDSESREPFVVAIHLKKKKNTRIEYNFGESLSGFFKLLCNSSRNF